MPHVPPSLAASAKEALKRKQKETFKKRSEDVWKFVPSAASP